MFVIVNNDRPTSPFVASIQAIERTGQSYTGMLQNARLFETRGEAMRDKCDNEVILSVREIMEARQ